MSWKSCPTSPIPPPPLSPPPPPDSMNSRMSSVKKRTLICRTKSLSKSPENKLPERKRRKKSRSTSESESDSSWAKELSKPRTLGELVAQTSKKFLPKIPVKKPELKVADKEPKLKQHDKLPVLTEEELKIPIIMNPDIPFDSSSMKINAMNIPSAKPIENGYLKIDGCVYSSNAERNILKKFEKNVVYFIDEMRNSQPQCRMLTPPPTHANCKCGKEENGDYISETSSSSSSSGDESDENNLSLRRSTRRRNKEALLREIARKQNHPAALHPDLVFNEPGMTNDGPACRCPPKSKEEGIRHNVFKGEKAIIPCNPHSNNADRLHHYVLRVSNSINQQYKTSSIKLGENTFTLRGFSLFFHGPLPEKFPRNPISRWTTEVDFEFVEEPVPECFTIGELEAFSKYILENVLEFYDFPRFPPTTSEEETCPIYHFMPRYVCYYRGSQAILPMGVVLDYFERQFIPFLSPIDLRHKLSLSEESWQNYSSDSRNMLLLNPYKKPSTLRVDGLERPSNKYPQLIHSTSRCPAYLSVQQAQQQTLQKKLHKKRKMLKMKKTPSAEEHREINCLQKSIDELKIINSSIRCLRISVSLEDFFKTGFNADIVSQVLTMSLACFHARLHMSFSVLESEIGHSFNNRALLELALTHPSFKQNYGIIADHARNALLTCGYKRQFRYEKYEDLKKMGGGPRMCQFIESTGLKVKAIQVIHNERLEYLGDAVVEMLVTHRLFFLLPHHQEGPLATYRSSIVQNRNLSALSLKLKLDHYLLFTHGPDLCHDGDFRHALANAFEALMGAIYLDSGLEVADRIFTEAMYGDDPVARDRWLKLNYHELQKEHPEGDRHLIETTHSLQKSVELENNLGYNFKHIRLLAKALTRRCIPYNEVTKGHNQRLEWLGDTVLQLIVSDYLYRHFPHHNEGHLSLLRTCIVSNKTQAQICDELCLQNFCVRPTRGGDGGQALKLKDKADLVEALLGALFVDGGWQYCQTFVRITFLPRLKYFLVQKRWSDEKSQLQHACLALRSQKSKRAECPHYRMLSQSGPTNSRMYTVGVFFRAKKLAEGSASNLHAAEMEAARSGLEAIRHLLGENDERTAQKSSALPTTSHKKLPSLMSYVPSPQPLPTQVQPVYYQQTYPYPYQAPSQVLPQAPQPLMSRIYYQ